MPRLLMPLWHIEAAGLFNKKDPLQIKSEWVIKKQFSQVNLMTTQILLGLLGLLYMEARHG